MVYLQDEFQADPYQEKKIEQRRENIRIKNQGKYSLDQLLLELLEVSTVLGQAWIGIFNS